MSFEKWEGDRQVENESGFGGPCEPEHWLWRMIFERPRSIDTYIMYLLL